MTPQTLLHRQIPPAWMDEQGIHWVAFRPTAKDAGRLSVFNGDLISAEDAWKSYTAIGLKSVGVVSVTNAECDAQQLAVQDDPLPDLPQHAVVIFDDALTRREINHKALALAECASRRGWQYMP